MSESPAISKKQINGDIVHLIIPAVLENVLQLLAGLVITAMVGRLMADDIAAQGISNRVYQTFFALFRGLATGATVIIALHFGRGDRQKCRRVTEQAYLTTIPIGLVVAVVIALFPHQILSIFTPDAALIETAASYSRIAAWAIPFMTIIAFNTASFNGQGDTKTPALIAVVLNVVNICVGYVAIFGIGSFEGWGIKGAAVATVVSQVVGAALGLWLLYRPMGMLALVPHGHNPFKLDKPDLKNLYASGLPAAAENLFWQVSAIIMSRVILSYGAQYYAAYQLGLQAEMLTEMPAAGFVIASTTLAARAIGQRNGPLYRAYFNQLRKIGLVVGIVASAALLLFSGPFMRIVTDKPDLQQIGGGYVFLMGFAQIPQVLSKIYNGVIRSSGGKRVPMYFSFIGIWVVRVPLVILFGTVLKWDINFIWGAIAIDQISRQIMSMIYAKVKNLNYCIENNVV